MSFSRALVSLSILGLVACNGSVKQASTSKAQENPPADAQNTMVSVSIPDDLGIPPQELMPELTKDQVRAIKRRFTSKPQIQLPPSELIFGYKKMDPSLREAMENEIKMRDKNEYDLMMEMRQLCKQTHYEAKSEAVIPPSLEEVERGDRFNAKLAAGVTNERCPLVGTGRLEYLISADRVEQNEIAGSAGSKAGLSLNVQSERYANLLNGRGLILNFDVGAAAISARQENAKPREVFANYGINGQYTGVDYVVPFKQKISGLLKEGTKLKVLVEIQMSFPEAKLGIAILSEGTAQSELKVVKSFLNGRETPFDQIVDLIGSPMIQKSQKTIVGNLQ